MSILSREKRNEQPFSEKYSNSMQYERAERLIRKSPADRSGGFLVLPICQQFLLSQIPQNPQYLSVWLHLQRTH